MNATALFGAIQFDELIRILVIIMVFLIPAIGKILANMYSQKQPTGPQRPPAPPMPQQQPKPQVQVAKPKSVKDEIDEFLRRAAQKRQMPSGNPSPRISRPAATLAQREEIVQADIARERPVGGEVSEHVKKYLDETQFDQRAAKFGGEIAAADAKIEQHMKEVFGHGIGKLAARPGETAAPPLPSPTGFFQDEPAALPAAGIGIAALIGNINNLRQAIVMNEILQRPVDRWK